MDQEDLTVRIDRALAVRLDQLARDYESSRDALLVEALTRFVDEEAKLIAAIKEGEADLAAGRVYTQEHVEVMFGVKRDERHAA